MAQTGLKCNSHGHADEQTLRGRTSALGLTSTWFRKAQDRDSWREKIQELLGHTQK